jgi:5-methylcytosine-specific restriction endonuclease McrA
LNTETGHIFVLDGAHRLSAIRAWITDDWGDSQKARDYGYTEDGDLEAAQRMRAAVAASKISSYEACIEVWKRYREIVNENKRVGDFLDPKSESTGKFIYNLNTSLRIPIQWVTGDYETAERSFININTGGTPLSDGEVLFLTNRRSPVARAITGIAVNGRKSDLWLKYRDECDRISTDLYTTILAPSDGPIPQRIADYPLCLVKKQKNFDRYQFLQNIVCIALRGETGDDNLRHIVEDCADEEEEEVVAGKTLETLQEVRRALSNIHGNQPQSLGLYPAFYFYVNRGSQYKDLLFLLFLSWASFGRPGEVDNRKIRFTLARDLFEEVWMLGKDSVYQMLSRRGSGPARITKRHVETLESLIEHSLEAKNKSQSPVEVLDKYLKEQDQKIHADFLNQYEKDQKKGRPFGRFSEAVKQQAEALALFHNSTQKCTICGGRVLFGSHQVDHVVQRAKGGTNSPANADLKHPFCNNRRDKLEGIKQYLGDIPNLLGERLDVQVPKPRPDSAEQLTIWGLLDDNP